MIDVVFLLLIFFMTTTTLATPESQLGAALQSQEGRASAVDLEPQIVDVEPDADAPIFRLASRRFTDAASLRDALARLPKDQGVFVRVADDARVEWAAAALQAARDAGFTKVSYVPGS
jgi:biopolymer transport protein ExbD